MLAVPPHCSGLDEDTVDTVQSVRDGGRHQGQLDAQTGANDEYTLESFSPSPPLPGNVHFRVSKAEWKINT